MTGSSVGAMKISNKTEKIFGVSVPKAEFELRYNVHESSVKSKKKDLKTKPTAYRAFQYHRDFMSLIKTWDRGNRKVREEILKDFIEGNMGKTARELDNELAGGASLLLTRITAWLRLNYLTGTNLAIQIKATRIFISSAGDDQFLNEFLEVGGVFTLLEILSLVSAKEADKAEAIQLIYEIIRTGPKYRDFVCECFGVRSIAEYMIRCKSDIGADYGRVSLLLLGSGNSRYLPQLSCQGLRSLLPLINPIHPSIVDAALSLMRNPFYEVQHECCELIRELINRSNLQDSILSQLISRLKTVIDSGSQDKEKESKLNAEIEAAISSKNDNLMASYMQQACSARLLGSLAVMSQDLAERMIELQCISGLLSAISNIQYPESQKYAVDTLLHLIELFPRVAGAIKEDVGEEFFDQIKNSPDTFYKNLTKDQIQYLNRNSLKVRTGGRGDGQPGLSSTGGSDEIFEDDPTKILNDKSKDEDFENGVQTGSREGLADGKKKDGAGGKSDENQSKIRGVYVPFANSAGISANMTKAVEEDTEDLDIKEATRIDTKKIEKKLAPKTAEMNVSLTDLKTEVPHLVSMKEDREIFTTKAQKGVSTAESLIKHDDHRPQSSR